MTAINQRIPNFLGGVSQQPDTIKFPGQLRVCDNAVPDVTFGLKKRPPGEFVKTLTNANSTGYWYEILRDGDEKYLMQVTPANTGSHPIRIWDLADGTEKSFTNGSGDSVYSYLAGATNKYAIQSIQDYTIIVNPNKEIGTTGTTDSPLHNGDYSFARLDTIAYNTEYVFYAGTQPSTNTYYRATALEVEKGTSDGNTWDDSNKDGRYAGLGQFSFSGGNNITVPGSNPTIVDLEGHVTVNGTAYIDSNTANYVSGASQTAENFLGYTQNYKTRYTAAITLKDGGIIKTTNESTALNSYIDLSIEGISYRVKVVAVEPVETYEGVSGIAFYRSPKNPDKGKLSMATILKSLNDKINSDLANVTSEVIGSGLFLYGTDAPSVNFLGGAVNENMNVIGNTAQDVSRLPSQCKHGYVAQIANSDNVDADNYYVKFYADNGVSGSGKWEECVRPNLFSSGGTFVTKVVGGKFQFDDSGINAQTIELQEGGTYIFDQSDSSNNSHPIRFSTTSNGTHGGGSQYTTGVTTAGTPGNAGAKTTIVVASGAPTLYYYCSNHSGMGGQASTVTTDTMVKGFDPAKMPHAVVNNRNGTFSFKKLDETTAIADGNDNYWKYREVGDDVTNPFPSFNGLKIQKIFFHRNRLGFVADEQVVMSRPGDYFNFFIVSALTTSDDNPVDITVSDIKPAYINHVLSINKGVMMFSDNGQFLLFTESDIFSPKTARLKKVSSYECDNALQPVDMGGSVMFTSAVAAYARAYEASILDDDVPPKITEQTRVVPEYLPKTIDIACNSTAIGINTFAKTGSSEVYHYKFFDSGDRRDQSAWYSWTIKGTLRHCFYTGGNFYTVALQGSNYILNKYEYVTDATSTTTYVLGGAAADVGSPLKIARWFEACLDNMEVRNNTNFTYTAQTTTASEKTVVALSYPPLNANDFYLVALAGTDTAGNDVAGTVIKADSVTASTATFNNVNLTGWTIATGYSYLTTVELPNYYYSFEPGKYDIDGDLRVSGFNFEMGVSGPMEFHLKSNYADMADYVQYESGMKLDDSDFGKPPSSLIKTIRVPIQKKNEKYTLQIQIPDPFSTALISASWDGNYNTRRHARQ